MFFQNIRNGFASKLHLYLDCHLLDPTLPDFFGRSSLHEAVDAKQGQFSRSKTSEKLVEATKILLKWVSESVDYRNQTAVHYAAERGCNDILKILLDEVI